MPFKVKATLVAFMGDVERFPCHFNYGLGDQIIYDGEKFVGRICPSLLPTLSPIIYGLHRAGNAQYSRITFRYSGLSARDESMKKYDGIGWKVLHEPPAGALPQHLGALSTRPQTELEGGWGFVCSDSRTSAYFRAEIYELADVGDSIPYYRREMAILDKVRKDPGLDVEGILAKFSAWEKDEIYPPLTSLSAQLFLEELASVGYLELKNGKAYARDRMP
jgi:uncharacterized repeat protein (TIGR04076 family)